MSRILNFVFFIYFATHIPITMFIDSQITFLNTSLESLHPKCMRDLLTWYSEGFKDPLVRDPPQWYISFTLCECILQFPFFFVAVYALWKGNCRWFRTPAIIYSTHVATTVIAIFYHVLMTDFTDSKYPGPSSANERFTLLTIYAPYLIVPILLLLSMLIAPDYRPLFSSADSTEAKAYAKTKRN